MRRNESRRGKGTIESKQRRMKKKQGSRQDEWQRTKDMRAQRRNGALRFAHELGLHSASSQGFVEGRSSDSKRSRPRVPQRGKY